MDRNLEDKNVATEAEIIDNSQIIIDENDFSTKNPNFTYSNNTIQEYSFN